MFRVTKIKLPLIALILVVTAFVLSDSIGLFSNAAAFPTGTSVLDNFNRADTSSIGGQTTSSGQAWSTHTINAGTSPTLAIESNQLRRNGNGDNTYITNTVGPDSEVFAEVSVLPDDGEYLALWSRIQSPGSNSFSAYALVYTHSTSGNASWSISRVATGSFSTLTTFSAPAMAAGDNLGLAVIGTGSTVTLTAYHKSGGVWTAVGSFDDTSGSRITAAGYNGLEIGQNTARLDNFGGGTIVPNSTPAAPTLSLPADHATGTSITPQFQLSTTDADSDDLQYKIEVCSDAACTNILRTIDQTASQTGWAAQDKQAGTAYASSTSLGSSTLAVHLFQAPALANSTQYWWRAYAIDPDGTNAFSPASSIFSFTTEAANSPGGNSGSGNTGSGSGSGAGNTPPSSSTYAPYDPASRGK